MGPLDPLSYTFESHDIAIFLTLILLEGILSFDNAAVIAAMVRRLPPHERRRALFYGLAGAYSFRFVAILLAAWLIQNTILRIIGGAYLVWLLVRHLIQRSPTQAAKPQTPARILGLSAFWSTIVYVEAADLVFALDQIVAAVALTQKLALIIAASFIAILALRFSAIFIIRIMDWFPPLETLAYVAVGWVGLKLLVEELFDVHVSKLVAVGVTLALLVLPVLLKLALDVSRRGPKRLRAEGRDAPPNRQTPDGGQARALPEAPREAPGRVEIR